MKAGAVGFGRKAEAFGLRRNPTLFAFALEVAWDDVGDTGAPVAAGVGVALLPALVGVPVVVALIVAGVPLALAGGRDRTLPLSNGGMG